MSDVIYYINDLGFNRTFPKFDIKRLPFAHMEYYPWHPVSWDKINQEISGEGNIIIIQTPVGQEELKLKIAIELAEKNIVFVGQESSVFDWFEWSATEQELYTNLLSKSKAFLHHSDFDKRVMSIFIDKFVKWNGCIDVSVESYKSFEDSGEYISLPTPVKRYQRGMVTHQLASRCVKEYEALHNKNVPIYSLSYNRPNQNHNLSFPDSYKLDNINLVPKMNHSDWMGFIHNSKFGIDINREFSGGNVSLEYAALGVPLIGNRHLDTQSELFPMLSFDVNDYDAIKNAVHLLLNDKDFYEECSKSALKTVKESFNSKVVVENFRKEFTNILNK
jgi:glycosyltransferase involved in cell wall biosynthesis